MNPVSDLRVDVMDEISGKSGVTFYLWCTGCRIPLHACLSQADWLLGVGAVKPTARTRARIVTKPFMARLLRFC
jgi:hypothetical protein